MWYGALVVTRLHRQSKWAGVGVSVPGSLRNLHCSITHCSHIPVRGSVNTPTRQKTLYWSECVCVSCLFNGAIYYTSTVHFMLLNICRICWYRSLFIAPRSACFNSVVFTPHKLVFFTTLADRPTLAHSISPTQYMYAYIS